MAGLDANKSRRTTELQGRNVYVGIRIMFSRRNKISYPCLIDR